MSGQDAAICSQREFGTMVTGIPHLLQGDVALVTDGAQVNGAAIARGLAASGSAVLVCDLDRDGAVSIAAEITAAGGRAASFHLDVADKDQCATVVAAAASAFGSVSILVNNTGIFRRSRLEDDIFLASATD